MKNHLTIPLILLATAFLLQLSAASAQAGRILSPHPQDQPRPTLAHPTSAPGNSSGSSSGNQPSDSGMPILPPPPTHTPTITPTFTETMDLSFTNFFARSLTKDTPTSTPVLLIDHSPTQIAVTETQPVTYSAPLQTITPVPGMYETVMKGVIIPVIIVVVIFSWIFIIRGLLLKRF